MLLAESFNQESKVVVIEENEHHPAITDCREKGIFVLQGDATKDTALKKSHALYAKYIIAVCDNDNINARIAAHLSEMLINAKPKPSAAPLCILHFSDYLRDLLEKEQIFNARCADNKLSLQIEVFNVYDSAARALLQDYPFDENYAFDKIAAPHVLIVGLGLMGQNLLERVALIWRANSCQHCLTINVIDFHASSTIETMVPENAVDVKICPHDIEVPSLEWKSGAWCENIENLRQTTIAYVCLEDDSDTIAAALQLHNLLNKTRNAGHKTTDIVMCLRHEKGAEILLHNLGEMADLKRFGILSRTCNAALPGLQAREFIAKAIHDDYCRQVNKNEPWEDLKESAKNSNYAAAENINAKLQEINCAIRPLMFGQERFVFQGGEVEALARMEHERWYEEKSAIAKQSAQAKRDIEQNEYYKLWENLTKDQKEENCKAIRKLPEILAKAGYEIYRLPRSHDVEN